MDNNWIHEWSVPDSRNTQLQQLKDHLDSEAGMAVFGKCLVMGTKAGPGTFTLQTKIHNIVKVCIQIEMNVPNDVVVLCDDSITDDERIKLAALNFLDNIITQGCLNPHSNVDKRINIILKPNSMKIMPP